MDEQWRCEVLDLQRRALDGRLQQRARLEPHQVVPCFRRNVREKPLLHAVARPPNLDARQQRDGDNTTRALIGMQGRNTQRAAGVGLIRPARSPRHLRADDAMGRARAG